jgi:hypothetical protein
LDQNEWLGEDLQCIGKVIRREFDSTLGRWQHQSFGIQLVEFKNQEEAAYWAHAIEGLEESQVLCA